jgi:hypothetical protein
VLNDGPPKRSSDIVNCPVPRLTARSLSLRGASPQRKLRERAGNARGAGARSSFGWQKSVGRIARLLHREVARPVGEHERALARKKFVAPLTRGANGQKAKRCACARVPNSSRAHGLRVQACRFSRRWKAFLGSCPSCSHRQGEAGSSGSQVQFRFTIREERDDGQHIGRFRIPTRVCLRVTTETSEVDMVR